MRARGALILSLISIAALPRCACDDDLESLYPAIAVTPASIDLGERRVAEDATAIITVGNSGDAPLTLKSIKVGAFEDPDELLGSLADITFADEDGAAFAIGSRPDEVGIDQTVEISVVFTPPGRGTFGGSIVIESDDPENKTVTVPVIGVAGAPIIEALPDELDFGVVNEGPGSLRVIQLRNTGLDFLHVTGIRLASTDTGAVSPYSLDEDLVTGPTIGIDEGVTFNVNMVPSAEMVALAGTAVFTDSIIVTSDAANAPTLEIPITGEVNLAPAARAVELVTRLTEVKVGFGREVVIDGSETVDPEGDAFTFSWSLAETPDPDAVLFSDVPGDTCAVDADCETDDGYRCTPNSDGETFKCRQTAYTHLIPNAAGTYVVRLRATDEHGAYAEADARILPKDFAVVMTWAAQPGSICTTISEEDCEDLPPEDAFCPCGQSDLDLHLIRPEQGEEPDYGLGDYGSCPVGCEEMVSIDGGPPQLVNYCAEDSDEHVDTCRQGGSDAAYANRYPEWGEPGRVDDPRLDVDDVRGDGPEVTTLNSPMDGTYLAAVHYCNDRLGNEPTLATIEVYVEGVLTLTAGPQLMNEGDVWYAASMARAGGPTEGTWDLTALAPVVTNVGTELCSY